MQRLSEKTLKIYIQDTGKTSAFIKSPSINAALKKCVRIFASELAQRNLLNSEKLIEFNLTLCGEFRIRTLNKVYRKRNKITDVLSFPLFENPIRELCAFRDASLGDVVICKERLIRQARMYRIRNEEELVRLFTHGFLHLLGYDHETSKKEETKMLREQERIIRRILGKELVYG